MYSIPEIASQLIDKDISKSCEDNTKTLILVGSKSVGKTTLLYSFLDKHDPPRDTLVLEYSFGRKTNQQQGIEKNVCHVWEYGGKLELFKNVVTSIPLRGKCKFFVMLDLSKIKNIWPHLEMCLRAYREIDMEKKDKKPEMVILGGKYDLFKNYDSEIKKLICTTLRCVGMIQSAHLFYYSSKEQSLVRKIKDVMYNFGFKNEYIFKEKSTNYAKPLFIPKGVDSWESIGLTPISFDEVKMKFVTRVPLETDVATFEDPKSIQQRTHAEPALDNIVNMKYDGLRNMNGLDVSIDEYLNNL